MPALPMTDEDREFLVAQILESEKQNELIRTRGGGGQTHGTHANQGLEDHETDDNARWGEVVSSYIFVDRQFRALLCEAM
jgi:hypothetical protein